MRRLLRTSPERIERLYLQESLGEERRRRLADLLERAPQVTHRPAQELDRIAGTAKHQGVVAVVCESGPVTEAQVTALAARLEKPLFLVLDGVQDPRNFGACLRTADAAGVDLVIVPRSRNVALTPAASKTAAGAAETQLVARVANLARCLAGLKEVGVWIVGADAGGPRSLFETDLRGGTALVLGAEGEGLRRLTREHCDFLVHLPMLGTVESLNVAVAAGICLYECVRQRLQLPGTGSLR